MTIPKTLGACADRLFDLKAQKAVLEKQIQKLDEERKAVEEKLIQELPKSDAKGVLGKKARAAINMRDVATVKDWPKLYAHILKTKDFSLLQRRASDTAVKELWDAGKKVPGIEPFRVIKVSITKL